jgi:GNAT superfamily N-acetyltransferase
MKTRTRKAVKWEPTATTTGPSLFTSWPGIVRKSDRIAEPGIRPATHTFKLTDEYGNPDTYSIETFEYRDQDGLLRGVVIWEPGGALSITVDPDYRRQGIATELMQEAVRRWPIDFEGQSYSSDGAEFVRKFLSVDGERLRRKNKGRTYAI